MRLSEKAPGVCLVVDVVAYRQDLSVLLVQKRSTGLWCLPGGFVEATDPSVYYAASRELFEETGLIAHPDDLQLLDVRSIDDPRLQADEAMFSAVLRAGPYADSFGTGQPGADHGEIEAIRWVSPEGARGLAVFAPHWQTLKRLGVVE